MLLNCRCGLLGATAALLHASTVSLTGAAAVVERRIGPSGMRQAEAEQDMGFAVPLARAQ